MGAASTAAMVVRTAKRVTAAKAAAAAVPVVELTADKWATQVERVVRVVDERREGLLEAAPTLAMVVAAVMLAVSETEAMEGRAVE